jgi:hypothetical protein
LTPEYLAGFFDGEGSLMRVTNSWRWRIAVTQATAGVLYDVRRMTGIGQVHRSKLRNSKWSPSWVYTVNRQRDVLRFLRLIAPHVIVKRGLIDTAVYEIEREMLRIRLRKEWLRVRDARILERRFQGGPLGQLAREFRLSREHIRKLTRGTRTGRPRVKSVQHDNDEGCRRRPRRIH